MTDVEVLKAVCCLAGADSRVTVEELGLLSDLAGRVGIERKPFEGLMEKANDESFRREQIDVVMGDVDGAMSRLMEIARQGGSLKAGDTVMLLWRVATKLEISPQRFDELLAAAESTG